MIAAVLLLLQNSRQKEQAVYDSITLTVDSSKLTVDLGEVFDPESAVVECSGDLTVSADVDTSTVGETPVLYTVSKPYGKKIISREFPYTVTIVDNACPVIELDQQIVEIKAGEDYDLASNIAAISDGHEGTLQQADSLEPGTYTVTCDRELALAGAATVLITAMNASGNTSESSYTLVVTDPEEDQFPYRIRINRELNCVTVYAMDENHEYTVPVKAMVCSTGTDTPIGTFHTFNRSTWRALFGGVYGQYATDIVGDILFHSVPYYSMNKGDVEYLEYNKLGTKASLGCIRLAVIDALWIFNNCPIGTEVEIYDDPDNPGPLGKPIPATIDENSDIRGWDPTDPDPANPWNA